MLPFFYTVTSVQAIGDGSYAYHFEKGLEIKENINSGSVSFLPYKSSG